MDSQRQCSLFTAKRAEKYEQNVCFGDCSLVLQSRGDSAVASEGTPWPQNNIKTKTKINFRTKIALPLPCGTVPDLQSRDRGFKFASAAAVYQRQIDVPSLRVG